MLIIFSRENSLQSSLNKTVFQSARDDMDGACDRLDLMDTAQFQVVINTHILGKKKKKRRLWTFLKSCIILKLWDSVCLFVFL